MSSEMTHHTAVIARVVLVFDQTDANTHVYEETNKMLADAWDNLVHIPGYSRTGGHLDVDLPNRQAFPAKFCQTNRQVDVVVPGKTWQRVCGPSGKMAQSMAFVGAARC